MGAPTQARFAPVVQVPLVRVQGSRDFGFWDVGLAVQDMWFRVSLGVRVDLDQGAALLNPRPSLGWVGHGVGASCR